MAWVHIVLLTLLPTILILTVLSEVESAAVKDGKDSEPKAPSKRVFVPASDASNFFKRRGRRSPKTYAEYYGKFLCHPALSNNSTMHFISKSKCQRRLQNDKACVKLRPNVYFSALNLTDHMLLEELARLAGHKIIRIA
uniref:Unique cartilage matrix-associated protein n=1 Tax=Pygocentrus nattereri TaxID=42514 RepID=A0A3B4EMK8_PYGNA